VVNGPPEVVLLAVDLHEDLVEMPPPVARTHSLHTALADLGGEHRPEPMPPEPHCLMTDVDAALVQQVFDVRSDKGNRVYIMTARRMISGLVLKYLNGERLVIGIG
jgi:hypothetical protein